MSCLNAQRALRPKNVESPIGAKNNTASFVTNDNSLGDPTTGDNSASVTVCRLVSGLTIGYWQNKNGQGRITANSAGHTCAQLYTYLHQFAPFSGLTSKGPQTAAGRISF
jgi:hypothetical protein